MTYTYKSAILGGTFDHFHLGHEQFIKTAFDQSQNVTIGVVEKLLSTTKSFSNSIEDYSVREANLKLFLLKLGVLPRTKIIAINDIYGTSLTDNDIEAIFVTESTRRNADKINSERQNRNLTKLKVVVVPFSLGDDGHIISSGRIRSGQIDRQGNSYLKYFTQKKIYHLPDNLRTTLQQPIGVVVKDLDQIANIIPPLSHLVSIGDIVSIDLQKSGYRPDIIVVDYHTRRHALDLGVIQKYFPTTSAKITNLAGTINSKFAEIFLSSITKSESPQIIVVNGEEDLLAIPAILLSPLGSYVVYGQYNIGMCIVKITEDIKSLAKNLLDQF